VCVFQICALQNICTGGNETLFDKLKVIYKICKNFASEAFREIS